MIRFAVLAALLCVAPLAAEPIEPGRVQVLDGDTIRANGQTYRLVGIDAPEISGARCPREAELARRATARLRELVDGGDLDLERMPCSCRPSAPESTPGCNHGRWCGTLRVGGRDVGDVLMAEGLAKPYPYDWRRPPAKPEWCDARRAQDRR